MTFNPYAAGKKRYRGAGTSANGGMTLDPTGYVDRSNVQSAARRIMDQKRSGNKGLNNNSAVGNQLASQGGGASLGDGEARSGLAQAAQKRAQEFAPQGGGASSVGGMKPGIQVPLPTPVTPPNKSWLADRLGGGELRQFGPDDFQSGPNVAPYRPMEQQNPQLMGGQFQAQNPQGAMRSDGNGGNPTPQDWRVFRRPGNMQPPDVGVPQPAGQMQQYGPEDFQSGPNTVPINPLVQQNPQFMGQQQPQIPQVPQGAMRSDGNNGQPTPVDNFTYRGQPQTMVPPTFTPMPSAQAAQSNPLAEAAGKRLMNTETDNFKATAPMPVANGNTPPPVAQGAPSGTPKGIGTGTNMVTPTTGAPPPVDPAAPEINIPGLPKGIGGNGKVPLDSDLRNARNQGYSDLNQQITEIQNYINDLNTQYQNELQTLNKQRQEEFSNLNSDFAARGLMSSSGYGQDYTGTAEDFTKMRNELDSWLNTGQRDSLNTRSSAITEWQNLLNSLQGEQGDRDAKERAAAELARKQKAAREAAAKRAADRAKATAALRAKRAAATAKLRADREKARAENRAKNARLRQEKAQRKARERAEKQARKRAQREREREQERKRNRNGRKRPNRGGGGGGKTGGRLRKRPGGGGGGGRGRGGGGGKGGGGLGKSGGGGKGGGRLTKR